jgi:hypothetical protein
MVAGIKPKKMDGLSTLQDGIDIVITTKNTRCKLTEK